MARTFKGKPGDLIEIFRYGFYQHWAVYIGGNEVINLVPEGGESSGLLALLSSRAEVKREKFTDLVGNDRYQVNNLLDNKYKAREPSVIVKEACEMVGRVLPYYVINNNSKHFATEMRYGKAESRQVFKAAVFTAFTGLGVSAVGASAMGASPVGVSVATVAKCVSK